MKTALLTLVCAIFLVAANGQARPITDSISPNSIPEVYLGIGTGVNSYTGILGVGADIRIEQTLFARVGLGIGSWGTKVTAGLRYALGYKSGWVFGLSYSSCSGLKNFNESLQCDSAGGTITKSVNLTLLRAGTVNITAAYTLVFHKKDNFILEFGYAVPLREDPYIVNDGSVLTSVSQQAINLAAPGGIVVSVGLMFGL